MSKFIEHTRESTLTSSCQTGGFQLLHAVYAVEYFLQGLIQRKCNFHVVFFDNHKDLLSHEESLPLVDRNIYSLELPFKDI